MKIRVDGTELSTRGEVTAYYAGKRRVFAIVENSVQHVKAIVHLIHQVDEEEIQALCQFSLEEE